MRMPLVAPTPVPTITAVGVAKPRAQGHAILKTVIAYWKAYWKINSCFVRGPSSCEAANGVRCHQLDSFTKH